MERERIILINLLFLNGYRTKIITAKTIKGDLNSSVTVNRTANNVRAVSEIITSCVRIV
jgi:hypothetical protein